MYAQSFCFKVPEVIKTCKPPPPIPAHKVVGWGRCARGNNGKDHILSSLFVYSRCCCYCQIIIIIDNNGLHAYTLDKECRVVIVLITITTTTTIIIIIIRKSTLNILILDASLNTSS